MIVSSLFVSSIAACNCSHHDEKAIVNDSSCHQHSPPVNTEQHQEARLPETIQTLVSESKCCCIQPAPRVYAKSEFVKIEKQSPAILSFTPSEIACHLEIVSVKFEFIAPFYLTDSFYNLSPGRAPPRL